MSGTSLGHAPDGPWRFDQSVTDCFEDMLRRSIPDYGRFRSLVTDVGSRFARPRTDIVDVGCSDGLALEPFLKRFGARNRYVGLEISEPMLEAARRRFDGHILNKTVEIRGHDLRDDYPWLMPSLTLCCFTLQFVPVEHRQRILKAIHDQSRPQGALILAEKVLGSDALIQDTLADAYHGLKHNNGYAVEEIERKRRSLENVLVPLTSAWNEQLLRGAGFHHVECIFRHLNFAAYLAVKA